MSAFLLVIPWLAVRHAVPALAGGDGAARAAHVPSARGIARPGPPTAS